jgi:uncharacterized protein
VRAPVPKPEDVALLIVFVRGAVIVVANPKLFEPECRTPEQMRWVNGMCRYRELAVRRAYTHIG